MNNSQKKIIAIIITVLAIINLNLPYAKFEYYGPTVSYKFYKSIIMSLIIICIAYSALSYGEILKVDRSKTKKSKFAISILILFLSIYKFATFSSGISIRNKDSIYSTSVLLRQEAGFQRGTGMYLMVFLAIVLAVLNFVELNKKKNKV